MTALEDRRPVAALTTASDNPSVIGEDLAHLLVENPDIELSTIRLIPNDDGTVGIAGRIGELAGVECPQCHQPAGRPHTEYCTLQLREEVFSQDRDDLWPGTTSLDDIIQADLGQTSQPATRTSQATTQARPIDDLVGRLRDAVDAARQRRTHERDAEVEDNKGVTWHQTGPDEAHERWRCEPAKCGWERVDRLPTQWCHIPGRATDHRLLGRQWHDSRQCTLDACQHTPRCATDQAWCLDNHPRPDAEPTPLATPTPLEGDYGHHLREDCPNTGNCIRHAIT